MRKIGLRGFTCSALATSFSAATASLLPGTKLGAFDRSVNAAGLTNLISNYNATQANQATPAGKVLIANGIMSLAQLQALGGVSPAICPPRRLRKPVAAIRFGSATARASTRSVRHGNSNSACA